MGFGSDHINNVDPACGKYGGSNPANDIIHGFPRWLLREVPCNELLGRLNNCELARGKPILVRQNGSKSDYALRELTMGMPRAICQCFE
jgi:hypothetical protein